jgi:spermidine synthase
MQKLRASLSRLFLNKSSKAELQRAGQIEKLQKEHQGRPFSFDQENLRFMYFSQKSVQSAMKLSAPDELLLGYTQAMMAFLLVNPAPQHILMIGLGGGSLVKFCYRHLPDCQITVLEIDADVINLRQQFMLPDDDGRLRIIHCDAIPYLQQHAMQVDAILLDGFDEIGLVEELNTPSFYAGCYAALKPKGILVANMWGKRKILVPLLSELRRQFSQNVWWCRSLDSYNLIVFSFKDATTVFTTSMRSSAQEVDPNMSLQLIKLLEKMRTLHLDSADIEALAGDYEARELVALTKELAELLVNDDSLPRNEAEWSEAHR